MIVYCFGKISSRGFATINNGPTVILFISYGDETIWRISTLSYQIIRYTYGAAPNALFFVSERIAEKVLVMTATKRLMSQKLRTMTQIMKKKQEIKNSESIMEYMRGDHYLTISSCG